MPHLPGLILSIILSVLFGLVIGLGNFVFPALVVVLIVSSVLLFYPEKLAIYSVVFCLLVVGTIESFLNIPQANWLSTIFVLMLWGDVFISRFNFREIGFVEYKEDGVTKLLWLYMFSLLLATLINLNSVGQFVVGLRAYFPFIGIFVFLLLGRVTNETLWKMILLVIAIGCLQGAYCIVEKFVIAPRIFSQLPDYEMMIGSFGGSFYSGGYTGEMAAFVCMVFVLVMVLVKENVIGKKYLWMSIASLIISVGFAETKIVFVILPAMLISIAWKYPGGIDKKLLQVMMIGFAGVAIIGFIYSVSYWDGFTHTERAFYYTFDPDFMVSQGHRGRFASIIHWINISFINGPLLQTVFGHGMGSSVGGTIGEGSALAGVGNAVKLYGPGLDSSALTKLLWDVGLLGSVVFLVFMKKSFSLAVSLSNSNHIPPKFRYLMVAMKGWIVAFFIMMPYQPGVLGGPAVQYLFWFSLGTIVYVSRWGRFDKGDLNEKQKNV